LLVHVLAAGLVLLMVNLGFWQLDRLDSKRAVNAAVAARSTAPVVDISSILSPDAAGDRAFEWRRVTAEGTWYPEGAVSVLNRSSEGVAGVHSVVPVRLADDRWLLVNRGFVPLAEKVPLPRGGVTVAGYLRPAEVRGTLGAVDSTDPLTDQFQRLDVDLIGARLDGNVVPMWLQMVDQSPRQAADWPAAHPLPSPDEGPHLSYAFQWFFFSLVAVAGWAVAARRSLRTADEPAGVPAAD